MATNRLTFSRRALAPMSAAAWMAGCSSPEPLQRPAGNSAVFITKAANYSIELAKKIEEGVRICGLQVKDKRILLKPNVVEFDAATSINTNVAVVAAALEVFQKLGAKSVRIGEGPGHRRDTVELTELTGYRKSIPHFDDLFVDLNRDDISPVKGFVTLPEFFFPNTALGADLIVSVAKMKTHHWAGATLSMKNFFGLAPGAICGWPKNALHRIGVPESIVGLHRQFRNTFAIVDGIVGMEGNGPIQGPPKAAGVLVMGHDVVAVDATCCRIMRINPAKIHYLNQAVDLGQSEEHRIEQRGEKIADVATEFALLGEHRYLRL